MEKCFFYICIFNFKRVRSKELREKFSKTEKKKRKVKEKIKDFSSFFTFSSPTAATI